MPSDRPPRAYRWRSALARASLSSLIAMRSNVSTSMLIGNTPISAANNNGNSGLVIGNDSTPASGFVVTNNIFIHNGDYGFEEQGVTGSNQYTVKSATTRIT